MKAMPFSFEEFQGKGFPLHFSSSSSSSSSSSDSLQQRRSHTVTTVDAPKEGNCYVGSEPTSVLDARRSPSPHSSSDTVAASAAAAVSNTTNPSPPPAPAPEEDQLYQKCGWESEQSILRLMMSEVDDEDPSLAINKLLQQTSSAQAMEFNAGFGVVDDDDPVGYGSFDEFNTQMFPSLSPVMFQQNPLVENSEPKPQSFTPQMVMMNQSQHQFVQNPGFAASPLAFPLQHQAKRLNTGDGSSFHVQKAQFEQQQQLQALTQQRPNMAPMKPKSGIGDQLSKAAELIETGNPELAQGILARLNHQLSPLGTPLQRAAFYFKEALQLLAGNGNSSFPLSPFNLILKIGAYKTFSEISPVLQFANFTSNQAILEATEGFAGIHVVDFDIGYGGQWASLMQELAFRNNNNGGNGNGMIISLKITAFASAETHSEFELGFTLENLRHFAAEINLPFDLEIISLEAINSASRQIIPHSDNDAIVVNLPVGSFANNPVLLQLALRFAKQLSPKILVSPEQGCDRSDAPFPLQIIHALSSSAALIESLDAVNMVNLEATQKIERCLIQPGIEKMVLGRRSRGLPPWQALFSSAGFSPFGFSNFAASQAECLVQRTPVRGFHVEKRHSSLVLCWQRKELASVSAWRS